MDNTDNMRSVMSRRIHRIIHMVLHMNSWDSWTVSIAKRSLLVFSSSVAMIARLCECTWRPASGQSVRFYWNDSNMYTVIMMPSSRMTFQIFNATLTLKSPDNRICICSKVKEFVQCENIVSAHCNRILSKCYMWKALYEKWYRCVTDRVGSL